MRIMCMVVISIIELQEQPRRALVAVNNTWGPVTSRNIVPGVVV